MTVVFKDISVDLIHQIPFKTNVFLTEKDHVLNANLSAATFSNTNPWNTILVWCFLPLSRFDDLFMKIIMTNWKLKLHSSHNSFSTREERERE